MNIDSIIAIRILYLLVTPFEKQKAYELGAIDKEGNALLAIKDMTPEQKSNYTMLHRLVFRLKKVLGTIPFGKTRLASFAAAYMLVKECHVTSIELDNLEEVHQQLIEELEQSEEFGAINESYDYVANLEKTMLQLESIVDQFARFGLMVDDQVVTNTSGMAGYSKPLGKSVARRVSIFDVKPSTFGKLKKGKDPKAKWKSVLEDEGEEGATKISDYIKKNPNGVMVIRCSETGEGRVLRYRKLQK